MGVILTAAATVVATAIGVWSERRWPGGAVRMSRRILLAYLYALLPLVYFFNLAHSHIGLDEGAGIVLALVSCLLAALLAWFTASRVLNLRRKQVGAVIVASIVINTGFVGFPLTIAFLGHDHLATAVLFDALVGAPMLLLVGFGVAAAFGDKAGESTRQRVTTFFTRNPPLYGAVLGLLAPSSLAPATIVDIAQAAVIAVLPLGFFAVGATLADEADEGSLPIPPPLTRPVMLALASRLLLAPGLLALIAAPLIDLPTTYRLMIAMPTGLNALVASHAYGLDNRIVAETIVWSTALVLVAALLLELGILIF